MFVGDRTMASTSLAGATAMVHNTVLSWNNRGALPCRFATETWVIRPVTACWHEDRHGYSSAPSATTPDASNSTCHPSPTRANLPTLKSYTWAHPFFPSFLVSFPLLFVWFSGSYSFLSGYCQLSSTCKDRLSYPSVSEDYLWWTLPIAMLTVG